VPAPIFEEESTYRVIGRKRGNPRIKPPFSCSFRFMSNPTVVNNVETIASVPWIVNNSGDDAKIGIGRSTGTKLISASGHVENPGVYEIELGLSVYEFMNSDEYSGE
jgi:NADH-quinone oxidoreductase subunit F